ncbi:MULTISPECIES: pyridoxal phosphate-dependent aminotransferase [unclassified Pseudodesulfovibrio]|uniref:pyridoxal phosphate-dependent aminotransferase n=1 Tax=unclassified Pseudodesulfovibrio TaxID=2661612 RepID=UPI000FEC0DDF|nr:MULTISPECIES: pyridoxal phosphate-dependent aminotransferase [unclassified Pseudodesulfovibrio]MCJ2166182.1 pyridoxal phosphate-dependent aminotransferase [Pseudodesulfovibrio sp. S3-i]RWU02352.1 pyridoxal phosphate-dependent aminotransferase [Pseudodesulfovibrio sp. S3]
MRISDRLGRIKPSATLAVNAKAQELQAQGREVISLAVGQPDFGTPAHVCEAAKAALDEGFTRYTPVPGIPELREAVAGYYSRFYGAKTAGANTIISNGGKQALYNLLMALVNPGDEVLIPAPYWVSYPAMVQLAEGVSVFVPTTAAENYLVTVEGLEAARTARTKVLILNSPSNPTGCCYTQVQLEAIAEWARRNGVFIISDEVYDRLVYAPFEPASLAKTWEQYPETIAIVGALSKSFCMTGWRVGYALGHEDLVKAMVKIQGQSTSNINSITQRAALAALNGPWDIVDEMKTAFVRRRDLAYEVITGWGAVCPKPDGAFYLFPVLDQFFTEDAPDSASMCTKILEEVGVALVPGSAFGDDKCIRFSYAVADEVLKDALNRVGSVLLGK